MRISSIKKFDTTSESNFSHNQHYEIKILALFPCRRASIMNSISAWDEL